MASVVSTELTELTEEHVTEKSIGVVPRLITAVWFALVALVPVAFYFWVFGHEGAREMDCKVESVWFFAVVPVTSAALLAFLLGAPIMCTSGGFGAAARGASIALLSYPLFIGWLCLSGVLIRDGSNAQYSLYDVLTGTLAIGLIGLLYVGWLIFIAGLVGGILLFLLSRPFRGRWGQQLQVEKRRAALCCWAALIIYLANGLIPFFLKSR